MVINVSIKIPVPVVSPLPTVTLEMDLETARVLRRILGTCTVDNIHQNMNHYGCTELGERPCTKDAISATLIGVYNKLTEMRRYDR